ncbi:nuclear transport factor 2 family protein [Actinocorallia longicatena]
MTGTALRIALAHHEAWFAKDLDLAMTYVADDIVCDAPAGRLEGAAAYRAFLAPFVQILLGTRMIGAFGDDETALIMYDTETVPVPHAPGAEHLTIAHGKITRNVFLFDRAPFDAARRSAT